MSDDEDLLAFDIMERIAKKSTPAKSAPPKPAAASIATAKPREEFLKPTAWVSSKKRARPSEIASPEGSDTVRGAFPASSSFQQRVASLTPPRNGPEVIDFTSSMSPTRPNRKFAVAAKPAAAAPEPKQERKSKGKKAIFPDTKTPSAELWIDKYVPTTEIELALFKKRITEFKDWLTSTQVGPPRILILTGPAGAGKTALVRVVGAEMGYEVSEWLNPARHIWSSETVLCAADALVERPRVDMESTLTQFRDFLLRSERYLPIFVPSARRRLILLEDLPFLQKAKEALSTVFADHLKGGCFPIVLILSDTYLGSSSLWSLLSPEVSNSKQVTRISVGSVAPTAMLRVLQKVAASEGLKFSEDELRKIADLAGGDLRHAINELQFRAIGPRAAAEVPRPKEKKSKGPKEKDMKEKAPKAKTTIGDVSLSDRFEDARDVAEVSMARDVSLSIFHAIGKILHNKRLPVQSTDDSSSSTLSRLTRGAPESEPEPIMHRIYVEPKTWVAFLHENYGRMLEDIDEAAISMSYVSDADLLARRWEDSSTLGGAVALIAARGIQYGSCHPPPEPGAGKFAPWYRPQESLAEKQSKETSHEIRGLFQESPEFGAFSGAGAMRTEILPYLRKIVANLPYQRSSPMSAPPPPNAVGGVNRTVTGAQRSLLDKMCLYSFLGRRGPSGLASEVLKPDEGVDSSTPPAPPPEGDEKPEEAGAVVRESKALPLFDDIVEC